MRSGVQAKETVRCLNGSPSAFAVRQRPSVHRNLPSSRLEASTFAQSMCQ